MLDFVNSKKGKNIWVYVYVVILFLVNILFWLFLVLDDDDFGLDICWEYFDNLLYDDSEYLGEFGFELVGDRGGDWVRYFVMLNMVEEILWWLGDV